MQRALELARGGVAKTTPNPLVGAVLVKNGKIIGEGFHQKFGGSHAEVFALNDAVKNSKGNTKGASLYVTLEPCSHFGKTPPCTDAIIAAGVKEVFVATADPFQKNSLKILKNAGIKVHVGLLEEEARKMNQIFFKNITKKLPYVTSKVAMTLDGKMATASGDSRGISSGALKKNFRVQHQAIMVGVNTILNDDPHLGDGVRIILDSRLRSPLDAQVFRDSNAIVFCTDVPSSVRVKQFQKKNIRLISCGRKITPEKVLKKLFDEKIYSVFLEGGQQVLTSFWESGMIDRSITFIGLKLAGGKDAMTPLGGKGISKVKDFEVLRNTSVEVVGSDVVVDGYLRWY